ncbi:hypothetical protein M9H77_13162 [Catharanthus roseus]|uniref:Uncharacterized protein n=1 Tax=Catharanthus roseus TaxID=4058 RepID=A0ACC0BJJ4_CATRO|nr:hypothetical protein M9H77_13162 [Catharanthus roseus]
MASISASREARIQSMRMRGFVKVLVSAGDFDNAAGIHILVITSQKEVGRFLGFPVFKRRYKPADGRKSKPLWNQLTSCQLADPINSHLDFQFPVTFTAESFAPKVKNKSLLGLQEFQNTNFPEKVLNIDLSKIQLVFSLWFLPFNSMVFPSFTGGHLMIDLLVFWELLQILKSSFLIDESLLNHSSMTGDLKESLLNHSSSQLRCRALF